MEHFPRPFQSTSVFDLTPGSPSRSANSQDQASRRSKFEGSTERRREGWERQTRVQCFDDGAPTTSNCAFSGPTRGARELPLYRSASEPSRRKCRGGDGDGDGDGDDDGGGGGCDGGGHPLLLIR